MVHVKCHFSNLLCAASIDSRNVFIQFSLANMFVFRSRFRFRSYKSLYAGKDIDYIEFITSLQFTIYCFHCFGILLGDLGDRKHVRYVKWKWFLRREACILSIKTECDIVARNIIFRFKSRNIRLMDIFLWKIWFRLHEHWPLID